MPFWRLYYHIVWATHEREPWLTGDTEKEVHGYLRGKAIALGAILHALGGTPDHVHLVVSLPPKLALAEFIGALKGSSSHHINHLPGAGGGFRWQDEYGVVSFAERHLPQVIGYVQRQQEHHQVGQPWNLLEHVAEETVPSPN